MIVNSGENGLLVQTLSLEENSLRLIGELDTQIYSVKSVNVSPNKGYAVLEVDDTSARGNALIINLQQPDQQMLIDTSGFGVWGENGDWYYQDSQGIWSYNPENQARTLIITDLLGESGVLAINRRNSGK